MNKTSIEWVRNPDGSQGCTWNPVTGCLNNCPYCYARKLANGRLKHIYLNASKLPKDKGIMGGSYPTRDPFYPRFWPERIPPQHHIPVVGKGLAAKGKGVFVCDMGELFGDCIPRDWQEEVFKVIRHNKHHRFYLLTKQPQNLATWSPFPDNCWVGVTTTDDQSLSYALAYLSEIDATIKFVSLEPFLGRIEPLSINSCFIDWVIIGAQSKPYKPPKIEWVEEIVRAADRAGIPVFLKDNLLDLVNYKSPETDFAFNQEGHYKQEMPIVGKKED